MNLSLTLSSKSFSSSKLLLSNSSLHHWPFSVLAGKDTPSVPISYVSMMSYCMPTMARLPKTASLYIEVDIYVNVCVEFILLTTNHGQHSCLSERQIHPSNSPQFILGRDGPRKEATVGSFTERERQVAFLCRIPTRLWNWTASLHRCEAFWSSNAALERMQPL